MKELTLHPCYGVALAQRRHLPAPHFSISGCPHGHEHRRVSPTPSTDCSTQESGPCTLTGLHVEAWYGASPEGTSMGEPTLLPGSTGRPSRSSLEGSPVHKGELMGDQHSYHAGPELVYCKI